MDLFENPLNGNGKYVRPVEDNHHDISIPELEQQDALQDEMEMVDISILPRNSIEVSNFF